MPGWVFGIAPAVLAHQKRTLQATWAEEQPRVSTRRLIAARETQKTGELPAEEALLLREIFDKYDKDGTDELDKQEMRSLMAALNEGIPPTSKEVDTIMKACDLSQTNGLSFEEFQKAVLMWYQQHTSEDDHVFKNASIGERRLRAIQEAKRRTSTCEGQLGSEEDALVDQVFDRYDKDQTGQISSSELKSMMTDLNGGISPTREEVELVMWSHD
eukprot:Sspe_Gene.56358::Locus_31011_Transcript_1_1_Confidence_1.000_Length_680::g.56358::m.56358